MFQSKLLRVAVAASSLCVASLASAAPVANVTFNPYATNGGLGTVKGTLGTAPPATFQAVGFASDLSSTLTINATTGSNVGFSETGRLDITAFKDASNASVVSGVGLATDANANYAIYGIFNLSGTGNWGGATYTANQAGLTFTVDLYADPSGPAAAFHIGKAVVDLGAPAVAFAVAFGSLANGASGPALTSLSASLNFIPDAGTTGAGGFFQAPVPFHIGLAVGNAGGNTLNTGYSVSNSGVVTVGTPLPGTNPGTANVTFTAKVPEPGALSLAGLALLGLGAAGRRRKSKAA